MEVGRVKILGIVENLVCRILRDFSTVIKGGVTSTVKRGKSLHTRVEIVFGLRDAKNQIQVHDVYNSMSSLFTRTSL